VKIKDVDGKIIKLEKKSVPFEVYFEKGKSGDGKGKKNGEVVVFKKGGKEYKIIVELKNVGKRWFDYYVVYDEHRPADGEKFMLWRADEGDIIGKSAWNIYCTTKRSFGWIVISIVFALLFLCGIAYFIWKKKRN